MVSNDNFDKGNGIYQLKEKNDVSNVLGNLLHCKPKCSYAKGERWSIVFLKNERAANGIQVFTDAENISSVMLKKTCQKITRANANRHSSSSFDLAASVALRRLFANCRLLAVSFSFYVRKLVFANFR